MFHGNHGNQVIYSVSLCMESRRINSSQNFLLIIQNDNFTKIYMACTKHIGIPEVENCLYRDND
jgi:hypothetical protein